jgi:nitrogen-specific signal transduction histidine kinase
MGSTQNLETDNGMELRDLLDDVSFLGRKKPPRSPARISQALRSVADFALIAVRHQYNERVLRRFETQKAAATMANRLAHEINNPLQCLTNSLYLASQDGKTRRSTCNRPSRTCTISLSW